ncbi:ABC transporter ATP-binding protein [Clostridium felsineum]|uniref:ABC transporter ATP-binding protein n=1 Tax=Clostridium felsineum TaxID=36839 RepID=UPI00098C755E|nr:ABC transporter ATP-binding protein [Clostridium felsineum]URZ01694.1 Linearmycin resistance ATP-binding protein LnrL [Clostridium felsineum]
MDKIIEVEGLVKKYNDLTAVKGISFHVNKGELFAFLGTNGAGKSTTIDILCTLKSYTKGYIKINGNELGKQDSEIRKDIGIVFQKSLLDPLLTINENLKVRASFYGLTGKEANKRIQEISEVIGLNDLLSRRYGQLSGGQRRKADIARALLNTPKILFLDEPTTGLDPQTRVFVWETVNKLQKNSQVTVFLTTHYMEEAACADRITIINKGNIVAEGTPQYLKDKYAFDVMKVVPKSEEKILEFIKMQNLTHFLQGGAFVIKVTSTLKALELLNLHKENIESFEVQKGNMDDVFLNIIGNKTEIGGGS